MNDFTKEELINIYNAACYELHHGCPPIELEHVKDKIQSMIEDYNECKHTLTMTDTFVKCQDCKKVIGYDE